ncbi:hypothetical protein [Paractinoplanes lichenicola]|uniref:Colicin D immunity protein domain-containing protein n=1 Tax=Paractinoplanes lichenicola TaxID=2802976 RepID=A0ABS1VNX4_9ACTN|nr:hypothetical protein [Actinoplanes lichenicola]MBL7256340.1 hypothetical protein [Actinoplanes lichenicola]
MTRPERPRAWARPSEAPPGSGTATQVDLMRRLVAGQISGPRFAVDWFEARRQVLNDGERTREPFERVLLDVFYLLEDDYVIPVGLRGPGDLTDEQLTTKIRAALARLDAL